MPTAAPFPDRARFRLADGRWLSFRTWGDPAGIPVLYCHGSPSSSAEARIVGRSEEIARNGVRLVAPDRPGAGGSSFQRGRRILDWVRDATELADLLELERFAVLGYSGGGPYALALAARLEDRLTAVTTVSGTAPFDVPGATEEINADSLRFMRLSEQRPMASRAISWGMGMVARLAPGRMVAQAKAALPPSDAAVMDDPEIARAFARMVAETTSGSPRGAQHDTALMVGPWGFDPAEVALSVGMWHGADDRNAPPAMARHLEERLPRATLTWLEGEGHVSAAVRHGSAILADLAQRASADKGRA